MLTTGKKSRSGSVCDSDLNVLLSLWWSSILLATLALLWMLGLIVARLFRERGDAKRLIDRQSLSQAYLAIMAGSENGADLLRPYQTRSRLLAETLLDLLGLVRGAERERLIEALRLAGVDKRLRWRLTHGSRTGRLAAVEALSAFPSDATRQDLRALHRRSNDAEIRIATVRTLIEIAAPPRIQDLIVELQSRDDGDSLLYAPVLRQLAIDAPEDALHALAIPGLPVAARAVTIDAVGASGDYRALPVLFEMFKAQDPVLRSAVVRALASLAHPSGTSVIVAALGDEAWDVRAEAAVAAGRIGGPELVTQLVVLLEDPVWWVRFRAADALARLGPNGREALRIAATSPIEAIQKSASMALAEIVRP